MDKPAGSRLFVVCGHACPVRNFSPETAYLAWSAPSLPSVRPASAQLAPRIPDRSRTPVGAAQIPQLL
jgi:hypothetical protein